ncbi:unnamed protein product [Pylaiella littoralis]
MGGYIELFSSSATTCAIHAQEMTWIWRMYQAPRMFRSSSTLFARSTAIIVVWRGGAGCVPGRSHARHSLFFRFFRTTYVLMFFLHFHTSLFRTTVTLSICVVSSLLIIITVLPSFGTSVYSACQLRFL